MQRAQLERQLGSQLHGSVPTERVSHVAEVTRCTSAKASVWIIELRSIRHAKSFRPKLQADAFLDRKPPEHGAVQVEKSRPAEGPAGRIA